MSFFPPLLVCHSPSHLHLASNPDASIELATCFWDPPTVVRLAPAPSFLELISPDEKHLPSSNLHHPTCIAPAKQKEHRASTALFLSCFLASCFLALLLSCTAVHQAYRISIPHSSPAKPSKIKSRLQRTIYHQNFPFSRENSCTSSTPTPTKQFLLFTTPIKNFFALPLYHLRSSLWSLATTNLLKHALVNYSFKR